MSQQAIRIVRLLLIAAVAISACSPMAASTAGLESWMDQPVTNSYLPMAPFPLRAHARDARGSGVRSITFFVNGAAVGSVSVDASQPLVTGELNWTPLAAGEYRVQARAENGRGTADSEVSRVCVQPSVVEAAAGYRGKCGEAAPPTVAQTTSTATPAPMVIDLKYEPLALYFGACSTEPTVFHLLAYLSGNAAKVAAVELTYQARGDQDSPLGDPAVAPMVLAGDHYEVSVDTAGLPLDLKASSEFSLGVTVNAKDVEGKVVGSSGLVSLPLYPCLATSTPVPPTVTMTPEVTAKPPGDSTSPSVDVTLVDPSGTVYYTTGCGANTVTVEAYVTDNASVGSVKLIRQYNGGSAHSQNMSPIGGDIYRAVVDVGSEAYDELGGVDGTLSLNVKGTDGSGNSATDGAGTLNVQYCPG